MRNSITGFEAMNTLNLDKIVGETAFQIKFISDVRVHLFNLSLSNSGETLKIHSRENCASVFAFLGRWLRPKGQGHT